MIEIKNITKSYKDRVILRNFNLTVGDSEKIGIIGDNGCGKSTLINILSGIIPPDNGSVSANSYSSRSKEYKLLCGFVLEKPLYIEELTINEMLILMGQIYQLDNNTYQDNKRHLVNILDLKDYENYVISNLSKGYKARVALAIAMIHQPKYLILDEPFDGLTEEKTSELTNILKKSDIGIIMASHNKEITNEICDKILYF